MADVHQASTSSPSPENHHDVGSSRYNKDVMKELEHEINVVLANRNKRLGWIRIFIDPVILPYYHFLLAIVCMIILASSSWTFGIYQEKPNYVIPDFLIESNLMSAINSSTFIFLDVVFAAIGLPLFCDLIMDIMGYFGVEMYSEQEKLTFQIVAEKAKEWCLRLQFIVAFAVTSMVRVFGPTDHHRKIILVYLTQFLRTIVMTLYGMFNYTDTFDTTLWEHIRSFSISLGLSFGQLLVYYTGLQEQTPTLNAILITVKVLIICTSFWLSSLFFYRLYFMFQRVLKPGGLTNLSTKELCFVVYGSLVSAGTIIVGISLSSCNFDLYRSTLTMYVCHAVMMLFHSMASSTLPVRIARYDVRRAQGLIRCTQQKVSNTIDSPLRYLMTEMDCLLHSVNFYQNLTPAELQSLERIVALCNDVSVSLEEIVDTDSSSDHRVETLYQNGIRNRHMTSQNREQMRVSFDLPVVSDDSDGDDNHMFENTSNLGNKGYGMSGSAMGESVLISNLSISQPDDDIESMNGKAMIQQLQRTLGGNDVGDGSCHPYPLNRRMRFMLNSLNEHRQMYAESSVLKDRELEGQPGTDALFDRLAATMRCREQQSQELYSIPNDTNL